MEDEQEGVVVVLRFDAWHPAILVYPKNNSSSKRITKKRIFQPHQPSHTSPFPFVFPPSAFLPVCSLNIRLSQQALIRKKRSPTLKLVGAPYAPLSFSHYVDGVQTD